MTLDGLADLPLDGVELHGAHHSVLLGGDADQEEPSLGRVAPVVDDLAASQTRVPVEDLLRLGVPFHRPEQANNTDSHVPVISRHQKLLYTCE